MSSVSKSTEIRLSAEETELLEKAIQKIEEIKQDLWNEDLFFEGQDVYYVLEEEYGHCDGHLPRIIDVQE